jgi:hypothetical protein
MRIAACAVLLSGCLIARTMDEPVEDPCPAGAPEALAAASGPFALADAIYFLGANGTLSRVSFDGGVVSELTTANDHASSMAVDASHIYWASDTAIVRKPLAGGAELSIANGYNALSELAVDDTSVVWASSGGLDRWSKVDQTVEHLDDGSLILGLGISDGIYYYSQTHANRVRRTPPLQDLAQARFPGPLVVDERGVYYYEAADPFIEYAGALRLVPRDGGEVVTTATGLSPVIDLASDDLNLYFATAYGVLYRIKEVSRFGGNVRTLACGPFHQQRLHIAVRDGVVFWVDGDQLYRMRAHY